MTVWNAAVLAVLITLFGAFILWSNQSRLRAEIDDDLRKQAEHASHGPPPNAPPRPQEFGDLGNGPLDEQYPPDGGPSSGSLDREGPGPGGRGRGGFANPFEAAGRLLDVRRPRFFDLNSKSMIRNETVTPFDETALRKAMQGTGVYSDVDYLGQPIRVYSNPVIIDGKIAGAVQFARELADLELLWTAQTRTLALVIPFAVLLAGIVAYALTGRTLRPVALVAKAAENISHSDDLARRLPVIGDDEIANLSSTINDMLARLETSFANLETAYEKLEGAFIQQQRFTADASHELRTPLTRMRLATSSALREPENQKLMRDAVETADRAGLSMSRLVQQLLTLARSDAGALGLQLEVVDFRIVVAEGLGEVSTDREIDAEFDEEELFIQADCEHLRRVVVNFVENALRHTPEPGQVGVSVKRIGAEVVLTVEDTGEGIAMEHLPHVFDRFYRADSARDRKDGGCGLGLAICKNLIEAHGGRVQISSQLGVGTKVQTLFPLFLSPTETQTISS